MLIVIFSVYFFLNGFITGWTIKDGAFEDSTVFKNIIWLLYASLFATVHVLTYTIWDTLDKFLHLRSWYRYFFNFESFERALNINPNLFDDLEGFMNRMLVPLINKKFKKRQNDLNLKTKWLKQLNK